jgi:hypothetical protein
MKRRQVFWDTVAVLSVIGMAYAAWEMIAQRGWFLGAVLAFAAALLGYLAFKMIYPMWFSD